jgi:hypothetical protein
MIALAIKVVCPRCNKEMRAPNRLIGRTGRCVSCGEQFPITAGSQTDTVEVAAFATEVEAKAPPKPKTAFYQFENRQCPLCGNYSPTDSTVCEACHNPFAAKKKPKTAITLQSADSVRTTSVVGIVALVAVLIVLGAVVWYLFF